ncbi:hypothetical protein BGZ94_006696 [Podila epigama]|nr:hypothetical protein BGZ94_006696 [Podila epigama]
MAQQKVSFKKWWKNITGTKTAKEGLFHVDLVDSIVYAGVPVQYTLNGKTRCQGYIPTIVSKCGWLLKEQAIKTKGIFRVSGSAKRVSELQLIFDTPPNYGSQLDWTNFTIHDASNVLRRYLNHLPDPVITLEYYEQFRDVHRNLTDDNEKIAAYQELISKLPPPHSCLLMYLLDLLALFAHHSEENLMDSKNLASVFQPGVLSHPNHAMSPGEYMTSAAVLKFLIDHQSSFTLPQPNIDEDDEEMMNFGLGAETQQHIHPSPVTYKSSHYHGGFVNAADHESTYDSAERAVTFGAEDLDSGIKRQLSLHKPTVEHASLPGNNITRSKSTSSSTSSRHSVHSGMFSSSFLTRRRSHRGSKSSSKLFTTESDGHEIAQESEDPTVGNENNDLLPRISVIKKATTSPVIGSDDPLPLSPIRRQQLRSEGQHREPSIFCETIEIPFPAPAVQSTATDSFKPSSILTSEASTSSENKDPPSIDSQDQKQQLGVGGGGGGGPMSPSRYASEPHLNYSPNSTSKTPKTQSTHLPLPEIPLRQQHEKAFVPPPQSATSPKTALGLKRASATTPRKEPLAHERPSHAMTIQRAKSNPGDLTSISARNQVHALSTSHSSSNHTYELLKGWISGKNKDHEGSNKSSSSRSNSKRSISSSRDKDKDKEKEKERSGQRRESLTERRSKQNTRSTASNGPYLDELDEHYESVHDHPPGSSPHHHQRPQAPPRPPPPPPESSLMDLLDPSLRMGFTPKQSSPSGSRSDSPSRDSSSAVHPLSANNNASITSPSSRSVATFGSDRLYHGRGPQQPTSEQYDQQLLAPAAFYHYRQHSNSSFDQGSDYNSGGSLSNNSNNNSRHNSYEALPIPVPARSASRTRQRSSGSHSAGGDSFSHLAENMAISPPPKSRERPLPRQQSSPNVSFHGTTPTRNRSHSRNASPARPNSLQGQTSSPQSHHSHNNNNNNNNQHHPHPQHSHSHSHSHHYHHHQHHGSSPLAEGQGHAHSLHSSPSSRAARSRAQSRDESCGVISVSGSSNNDHGIARPNPPEQRNRSISGGVPSMSSKSLLESPSGSPALPSISTFGAAPAVPLPMVPSSPNTQSSHTIISPPQPPQPQPQQPQQQRPVKSESRTSTAFV